jgi:rhamnosyltransferase
MPKVAVILATFNSEKFIKQQVFSILWQRSVSVEIIVYDDKSEDETVSLLKKMAEEFPINFISSKARFGFAGGSFFHLISENEKKFISYDYVALADHDDIWHPDKLAVAISHLEESNAVGYSSSVFPVTDGENGLIFCGGGKKSSRQRSLDYFFEGPGPGCTFVLKSQFASELAHFVSTNRSSLTKIFWHDWFIYFFARSRSLTWVIDERAFTFYIQHQFNETGVNSGLKAILWRVKLLFSGGYLHQAALTSAIVCPSHRASLAVSRFNLTDRIWLARNIFHLRRRALDCIVLFLTLIINPFLPREADRKVR